MRTFTFALIALVAASAARADGPPIVPDPALTPGAILTTDLAVICHPGYSKTVRHTSGVLKAEIYREYGIDRRSGHFEIDHDIPLSWGGADVKANLWPESRDTEPYNANVKDRLEEHMIGPICRGEIPIEQAQHDIAADWIGMARKYGIAP